MKTKKVKNHEKAWVVAVDMGYGHQRAAFPLKDLAFGGKIINANTYRGITTEDREIWDESRGFYEFISNFKSVPLIGQFAWQLFDKWQGIDDFYPKRDLSEANFPVKSTYSLIKRKNWGKNLIKNLEKKKRLPIITTFFVPAFMAEIFNYAGDIYCVVTDADISRNWVPLHPNTSRIKYFAPCYRVVERLKLYGVRKDNIYLTGFPIPKDNLGKDLKILRNDLAQRLVNLDPKRKYISRYEDTITKELCIEKCPKKSDHPLTVMFAVGGAGAQRDIGIEIVKSLSRQIIREKIRVVLVAGTHGDINNYFKKNVKDLGLRKQIGKGVKIVFSRKKEDYFKKFAQALRKTDIVWTKPSELSFYTALGLPIIMAPPIGSQEKFNKKWLLTIGSGVSQEDPQYTHQWLFDWIKSGWFAEAAMQGYMEAPQFGASNIENIIKGKVEETEVMKTVLQY